VRQHLERERAGLLEDLAVRGLREGARRGGDTASPERDLLVWDAGDLLLVLLGAPAGEGQVRVAVDQPGQQRAAGAVDDDTGVRIVVERRYQAVPDAYRAGLEAERGRAVVAQIRKPVLGWPQDLDRVPDAERARLVQRASPSPASIGTRTPRSRATAIASA
jgi:hypothetical protein